MISQYNLSLKSLQTNPVESEPEKNALPLGTPNVTLRRREIINITNIAASSEDSARV
jgi:hypothetical protein